MRYFVTLDGHEHELEYVTTPSGSVRVISDGTPLEIELLDAQAAGETRIVVDGRVFRVRVPHDPRARSLLNGSERSASVQSALERLASKRRSSSKQQGDSILAPLPGRVVQVRVAVGDLVGPGDSLVGIEAMKMENDVLATGEGRVAEVRVTVGDTVESNQVLIVLVASVT